MSCGCQDDWHIMNDTAFFFCCCLISNSYAIDGKTNKQHCYLHLLFFCCIFMFWETNLGWPTIILWLQFSLSVNPSVCLSCLLCVFNCGLNLIKNGASEVVFMKQQTNHPFFIIWTRQGSKAVKSIPVQPNPRTLWSCSSNWEVHFYKLLPSHYLYSVR